MTLTLTDPRHLLDAAVDALMGGRLLPYLGPGISALAAPAAPMAPEALAEWFGARVALPRRARGNAWAAAQHIESHRHRSTVSALMADAFSVPVPAAPLHHRLAALDLPLIVDSWYAGEMRRALASRDDWAEVQGITRAGIGEDRWFRFYRADGAEIDAATAQAARTILYTPHGSAAPAGNFLISDADYVEVLTEIDIQTPIPEVVRDRRQGKSFLFLGCRFNDQLLRSYARQILKRSHGRHLAVVAVDTLTRNERHFLEEMDITPVDMPLALALERLCCA
jgi:hypothetical protein